MNVTAETEKKQYKFDPFQFISNRQYGIVPTSNDFANFNNYMCCAALSMNPDYLCYVPHFNSMGFSRLTDEQQCLAYTSLDGKAFPRQPWLKAKAKDKDISKDDIKKVCKLLDCSVREAKLLIEDKSFDMERAMKLYVERYDASSLVNLKGRGLKKGD